MTVIAAFIIKLVHPLLARYVSGFPVHVEACMLAFSCCVLMWLCVSVCARVYDCWCVTGENRDKSSPVVSVPSYLQHSQKQVYKLIGKWQTFRRLVKHTFTFPASEADERIGRWREGDQNDGTKTRQKEEVVEVEVTEQEEEIAMEMEAGENRWKTAALTH